jgi:dolichol-phosphate mannosyltransferase
VNPPSSVGEWLASGETRLDISVVIPCYNEIDNLPQMRSKLLPVLASLAASRSVELVLVDDGSTDGTLEALTQTLCTDSVPGVSIKLVEQKRNGGLGKALRAGLAASTGDIVVTTDSDGTYDFSHIPMLLAHLTDEVDIVTASPYHPQGRVAGVPAYRLVLSRGSSAIYRCLVNWRIYTYTALFRAYRRHVIEEISFSANGFLSVAELLVKSQLSGYRVVEYPATLNVRAYGSSKAKLVRTILAHLQFQLRVVLHRLGVQSLVTPSLVDQQKMLHRGGKPT